MELETEAGLRLSKRRRINGARAQPNEHLLKERLISDGRAQPVIHATCSASKNRFCGGLFVNYRMGTSLPSVAPPVVHHVGSIVGIPPIVVGVYQRDIEDF